MSGSNFLVGCCVIELGYPRKVSWYEGSYIYLFIYFNLININSRKICTELILHYSSYITPRRVSWFEVSYIYTTMRFFTMLGWIGVNTFSLLVCSFIKSLFPLFLQIDTK